MLESFDATIGVTVVGNAELWARVGVEAQRGLDDAVASARADLLEKGFPARGHRFPYALHHSFYRSRIRIDGRKTTHSEVSFLLGRWAATRDDARDYVRQAICGSVKLLLTASPELAGRVPASVRSAMAGVGDGYEFRKWASSNGKSVLASLPREVEADRDARVDQLIDAVTGYRAA